MLGIRKLAPGLQASLTILKRLMTGRSLFLEEAFLAAKELICEIDVEKHSNERGRLCGLYGHENEGYTYVK